MVTSQTYMEVTLCRLKGLYLGIDMYTYTYKHITKISERETRDLKESKEGVSEWVWSEEWKETNDRK